MKTPEQRKTESTVFLKAKGLPLTEHLPPIESEEVARLRSAQDVAKRVICLVFAADFAQGHADDLYWQYIRKNSLETWFSPLEWKFINSSQPTEQSKIDMSWRIEAAYPLMWALGRIEELPFPTGPSNPDDVYACLPPFSEPPTVLLDEATLLPKAEVLDKADLIYRMHWVVRQAAMDKKTSSGRLHNGVVREWHHAMNWLMCYGDSDWDNVTTDT